MNHPRVTISHTFLRTAALSGAARGQGMITGDMRLLQGISGKAAGNSELLAAMRELKLLASQAAGNSNMTGDISVALPIVYHIVIIGQSNAAANSNTTAPILVDEPVRGYMFAGGLAPGTSGLGSLVAMQEGTGQTIASVMAEWLATHRSDVLGTSLILVSNVAVSGEMYAALKKGTTPYNNSIAQVTAAATLAAGMGLGYRVLGLACLHGETDGQNKRPDYRTEVAQWQADYDTDIRAITGQTEPVRLFAAPQFAYSAGSESTAALAGASDLNLFRASQDAPGLVICVTPQSIVDFTSGPHFNNVGQVLLGERLAAAMADSFFDDTHFLPVHCISATISDKTVVLRYHVPVPPLRWDYEYVGADPLGGFRWYDSEASATVVSAALTGSDEVTLTLSDTPTGDDPQVRYMCHKDSGPSRWIRAGNLADSTLFPSLLPGLFMPHYAVSQLIPIPL